MQEFPVKTRSRTELVDITSKVRDAVKQAGAASGVCHVFIPHTTAAVTINENADPAVIKDVLAELNKVIPFEDAYTHMEGNSAAHIKSSLVGCSETVIVEDGELQLGTWQSLFFCEFDGPRSRRVWVQVT